jgi:hypothetical protein
MRDSDFGESLLLRVMEKSWRMEKTAAFSASDPSNSAFRMDFVMLDLCVMSVLRLGLYTSIRFLI